MKGSDHFWKCLKVNERNFCLPTFIGDKNVYKKLTCIWKVTNLWKQWPLFVHFSSENGQAFLMLPYLWSEIHGYMISGCSYQNLYQITLLVPQLKNLLSLQSSEPFWLKQHQVLKDLMAHSSPKSPFQVMKPVQHDFT